MLPDALIEGYRCFRSDRFAAEEARYRELTAGQSPETMIIGCADSRCDPATIFAAAPGELFVIRNVAALVPPSQPDAGYHGTSAAIEFAVEVLHVKNIVVMGHGLCGGVAASLASIDTSPPGQFIGPWVELLSPLRDRVIADRADTTPEELQRALERYGILFSLQNLRTFDFVERAIAEGRLSLHGAWFSIGEATLHWFDPASGLFEVVEV